MTTSPDYLTDDLLQAALPKLIRRRARMFLTGLVASLAFEVTGTLATSSEHRTTALVAQLTVVVVATTGGLAIAAKPARKVGRVGYSVEERRQLNVTKVSLGGPRRLWVLPAGGVFFAGYLWVAAGPAAMAVFASLVTAVFLVFLVTCTLWRRFFGPHASDLQVILSFCYHPEDPIFH